MPKYRDFFRQMLKAHEAEFAAFSEIHNKYAKDQQKWQAEYNAVGAPIQKIIREWEQKLCGHSEKGKYAKFSSTLAEKFQAEVKAFFPYVDFIGIKVTGPKLDLQNQELPQESKTTQKPDPDLAEIDAMGDDFDIPKLF
jgi:hypothetical protein